MEPVIYPLPEEGIYLAPRVPPPDWVGIYDPPLEYLGALKFAPQPPWGTKVGKSQ